MSVAGTSPRAAASVSAEASIRRSERRDQTARPTTAIRAGVIKTRYATAKCPKPYDVETFQTAWAATAQT